MVAGRIIMVLISRMSVIVMTISSLLVSHFGIVAVVIGPVSDDLSPSVGKLDAIRSARHLAVTLLPVAKVVLPVVDVIFEAVRHRLILNHIKQQQPANIYINITLLQIHLAIIGF